MKLWEPWTALELWLTLFIRSRVKELECISMHMLTGCLWRKGLSAALLVKSMQQMPGETHCRAVVVPLPGFPLPVASLLLILCSLIPLPGHPLPWFIYSYLRISFQVSVIQKGYGLAEGRVMHVNVQWQWPRAELEAATSDDDLRPETFD